MSKIASLRARRTAMALLATLSVAAPALAEARVQPVNAVLDTGARPALTAPAQFYRVAEAGQDAGEKALVTTLVMTCSRHGARMVC